MKGQISQMSLLIGIHTCILGSYEQKGNAYYCTPGPQCSDPTQHIYSLHPYSPDPKASTTIRNSPDMNLPTG